MNLGFFCALQGKRIVRAIQQVLPFLKHSQGNPQRFFDLLTLAFKERWKGKRMPGVAAVSGHLGAIHFPKNSAALGAVIWPLLAEALHCRYVAPHSLDRKSVV